MKHHYAYMAAVNVIVVTLFSGALPGQSMSAAVTPPPVPSNLQVPTGNSAYAITHAIGTQNYVCIPGAGGPVWKFLGPQATLFARVPWMQGPINLQMATHFLSANPEESGTARPTWQSSHDTSTVWGKAAAESRDPAFVAPGAIPWLLVEITGSKSAGPGVAVLTQTTYIQRVNTAGGAMPATGCDQSAYGKVALVPYTTDYIFYRGRDRK